MQETKLKKREIIKSSIEKEEVEKRSVKPAESIVDETFIVGIFSESDSCG